MPKDEEHRRQRPLEVRHALCERLDLRGLTEARLAKVDEGLVLDSGLVAGEEVETAGGACAPCSGEVPAAGAASECEAAPANVEAAPANVMAPASTIPSANPLGPTSITPPCSTRDRAA